MPEDERKSAALETVRRGPKPVVFPALLLVLAVAIPTLVHYHDRFWYPPDDGNLAYIATRLLAGDVLHRDVQAVHTGLVFFLATEALRFFGDDLVSLRYPLAFCAALSAFAILWLLWSRSRLLAVVCAATWPALTVVQFLNATPHWYCVFLFPALVLALERRPRTTTRLLVIGALLGLITLFRQLTGAFLGLGVLAWLLVDESAAGSSSARSGAPAAHPGRWTARFLVGAPALLLVAHLAAYDLATWLLFSTWPLLLLALSLPRIDLELRELKRLLLPIGAGALVVTLPLLGYHLAHRSLGDFFQDTVVSALQLSGYRPLEVPTYGRLLGDALVNLVGYPGLVAKLNAVFWIVAVALTPWVGLLAVRGLLRGPGRRLAALPFLAPFLALISVRLQIPIYLSFSTATSIAALAWWASSRLDSAERSAAEEADPSSAAPWPVWPRPRLTEVALAAGTVLFAIVALRYHAAQPLSRGIDGALTGRRIELVRDHGLPRASLWIERAEAQDYRYLLDWIERETDREDTVLALPSNAELNYLSGRRSPVRFFNSAIGLPDAKAVEQTIARLERAPPRLVFFDPLDKYASPETESLMDWVRERSQRVGQRRSIEIYRLGPASETAR